MPKAFAHAFIVFWSAWQAQCLSANLATEPGRRYRVQPGSHEPVVLRTYHAPVPCGLDRRSGVSSVCGAHSKRFPPTLFAGYAERERYRKAMCDLDDGVEMEQLNLSFAVTKVSGGETCVYMPSSKVGFGMYREVWNSTHTILLGDWEGKTS